MESSAPDSAISAEDQTLRLQNRIPGHAVITELLAIQNRVQPRSRLGRIFGANPLSPDSLPWYQGALGEIRIGHILTSLRADWTVLHAVPVGTGSSDIDHVLIGPAGVFTLNTKNHANQNVWVAGNTFMVAGRKQCHISNAVHEASRAAKLLAAVTSTPVPVTGVVVIVGAKKLTIREKPAAVRVLTERQLLRWLTRRKPVLTSEQIAEIVAAASRPETWHRNPPVPGNPAALRNSFIDLQRQVSAARARRTAWAFGALAAMGAILAALIPAAATLIPTILVP
ncbi:nuclease-related domain-containing protein [Crystallibacter degradans]|uniref:nuclease-related domain-containing protein n=1 Tax=Crystallibacter degradans TaxID=2726743 RepID=UPI001F0E66E1|nr:nuclease-related domain-containing protein [Arthrobacter sp. SF27]